MVPLLSKIYGYKKCLPALRLPLMFFFAHSRISSILVFIISAVGVMTPIVATTSLVSAARLKIPRPQQKRILQAVAVVSKDPYLKNNNIKRLTGILTGYFRLRIGNYRVLYLLDPDAHIVFIKAVLPRNEKTYK
jgi:mRNA-degrading endonuclease RelE of RelBE toxin-antitoxin system